MKERSNTSVIDRRLRHQVAAARVASPPDLERRVLDALVDHRPSVALRARRDPPARSYLSAAGLVLLVGALALVFSSARTVPPVRVAETPQRPVEIEIVIGIDTTRYESLVNAHASHLTTAFESPLFDQARRMIADARHAVGSVLARVPAPVRIEAGPKKMRSPGGLRKSDV